MNINFEEIREQIRAFRFDSAEPKDWDLFFDLAVQLLDCKDRLAKGDAINRIYVGLRAEQRKDYRREHFVPLPTEKRLPPILHAFAKQTDDFEFCIANFAHSVDLDSKPESRAIFESWLEDIADVQRYPHIHPDSILVGKLESGSYPKSDWEKAKNFLVPCLSSENAAVRASAAGALGKLYDEDIANLPPLLQMMKQVKAWDIEKPGVAGPFWTAIQFQFELEKTESASDFDITKWMLDILENRKGEEPRFYCYNGIDFHAHEVMSADLPAIRKLIEIKKEEIAAMAATEIDEPIEGMRELLIELGNSSNDQVCRTCCWHLAYNYKYLHPKGKDRDFVALEARIEGDVFLVLSNDKIPYAATVYPKGDTMDDSTAMLWIDRLVPSLGRLPAKQTYQSKNHVTYDFGSTLATFYGDPEGKVWKRIWVKYPAISGW
jgi:hypothetical protein